jgi:hypothetical protein
MFRTLLICTIVSACAAACTSTGTRNDTTAATVKPVSSNCVISGTRIVQKGAECSQGFPGRSFSQEDLDRTGDTNAADALQKLDPSVTVHH